jgi:hypothetical protein
MCLGKTEEMLLDADRALEISPSALYVRIARSFIYVTADRLEAALDTCWPRIVTRRP